MLPLLLLYDWETYSLLDTWTDVVEAAGVVCESLLLFVDTSPVLSEEELMVGEVAAIGGELSG